LLIFCIPQHLSVYFVNNSITALVCCALWLSLASHAANLEPNGQLVFMTDFGTTERFVASMKGVAMMVSPELRLHDLTHHIEAHDIWQASFVLVGTIEYWPKGTVFVSVVDPGVGTSRKSVVVETGSGHFVVTPDNGTLTHIADTYSIRAMREIDESLNRRAGSDKLNTFHGRDVYAYTGARLAAGIISFEEVGPVLPTKIFRLDYQQAKVSQKGTVLGNLVHVEIPFGNLVSNIPTKLLLSQGLREDDTGQVQVTLIRSGEVVFDEKIPYASSFGFVAEGESLLYSDSLQTIGLAVNSASFAKKYGIGAGAEWVIKIRVLK